MSYRQSWGMTRRESLQQIGTGMGVLGLAGLLAQDGALGDDGKSTLSDNPLIPKAPHFAPKAKHVIHLFMNGGPSQVIRLTQNLLWRNTMASVLKRLT
jgi:hypothetical protein